MSDSFKQALDSARGGAEGVRAEGELALQVMRGGLTQGQHKALTALENSVNYTSSTERVSYESMVRAEELLSQGVEAAQQRVQNTKQAMGVRMGNVLKAIGEGSRAVQGAGEIGAGQTIDQLSLAR